VQARTEVLSEGEAGDGCGDGRSGVVCAKLVPGSAVVGAAVVTARS